MGDVGILERSEENSTGAECGSQGIALDNVSDEGIIGRGRKRGFAASRTLRAPLSWGRVPNISRQPLIGNPKHYDGDHREAQAKPSITGAKYRIGFTLAEILITLSIIGIVAALTIPSMIVKNREKQTVVQLKKAYNVLSNAFALAKSEYGPVDSWDWGIGAGNIIGAKNVVDKIEPQMNIIKRCNGANGCYSPNLMYKFYDGSNNVIFDNRTNRVQGILADGMLFGLHSSGNECTTDAGSGKNPSLSKICGEIDIDVNGNKPPNAWGKDVFQFYISNYGVMPKGTPNDTSSLADYCRKTPSSSCAAWVLVKENLDYPPIGMGWEDTSGN